MPDTAKRTRVTGPLSLEGLTDAPPVRKDSGVDLSQFVTALRSSWDRKQANSPTPGVRLVVDTDKVTAYQSRFRQAARSMGLGVAFEVGADADGKTALVAEARKKKVMKPKPEGNGAAKPVGAAPAGGLPKPQANKK